MTTVDTPAETGHANVTTVQLRATAQLSDAEKAAYRALMRVVLALPRAVSADLVAAGGLGLTEHLVLQNLLDAQDRQLRVTELAFACGVSVSGITRIVHRLDRAGLTTRARSTLDGRGAVAALTPAGAARLEQARRAHAASIRRHVFDRLAGCDLAAFTTWLESIAGAESPRTVRKI
jgi:DNA-binding MarR family transcriptional regulator